MDESENRQKCDETFNSLVFHKRMVVNVEVELQEERKTTRERPIFLATIGF